MKWLKYRERWASGDMDWKYMPLYDPTMTEEGIRDYLYYIDEDNSWSDKYGGIEYFVIPIKQVPNKHIENVYKDIQDNIKGWKESIKEAKKCLPIIEALKGKGRKTCPDEIRQARYRKRMDAQLEKLAKERKLKGTP